MKQTTKGGRENRIMMEEDIHQVGVIPCLLVTGHELLVHDPNQMRILKRVESPKQKIITEGLMTSSDPSNSISTSEPDQRPGSGSEGPPAQG